MKYRQTEQHIQALFQKLKKILQTAPLIYEEKACGLACYYRTIGKRKKLLFYLNPRTKELIFGISHRGTDILDTYPMLKIYADKTRTSVMKFSLKHDEDIERKGIREIIVLLLG